jgi:hypothetical protein
MSKSTVQKPKCENLLDGRGVAGLVVGCVFAGAIIASLVAFLLIKFRGRTNKGYTSDGYGSPMEGYSNDPKKTTAVTMSIPENSSAAIVENNLPQPKEDNAITGDFSKLKNKLDGHVQTFYQTGPANDQAAAQALAQILGERSPISTAKLLGLLSNPRSRPAILRSALAWIIVSRVGVECDPKDTFLPAQVTGAVHTLPPTRMDEKSTSSGTPYEPSRLTFPSSPSFPEQVS